jgi:uncharacterized protein (DUF58 family)
MALLEALAFTFLMIGIGSKSQYLIAASIPVFLFMVLVRLLARNPHLDFVVERAAKRQTIYEGEVTEVTLKIDNQGRDIDVLEVFDAIPEGLRLAYGTNHLVTSLRGGEHVEATYAVSAEAFGIYRLGPIRLRSLDISGLLVEERTIESRFDVKVYPEVQYVRRVQIKPRNPRNWPGEILTRKSGTGMEFYGLRAYYPSDPLKRINWKASSRSAELLSNQFMGEFGGDTIIVLDLRSASVLGTHPESTTTYGTRAAAIVAYRLLRDRNRVGLIALGDRLEKVRPGFGRRQFDRLLTGMVTIRPGNIWEIGNLPGYLSLFFSRMTQIVMVTPLMDAKSYEVVAEISNKGYPVLVVSPSPIEFEGRKNKDERVERIAEKLARLERDTKVSLLRRYAVVIDWNVKEPLSQALRQANLAWARAR